VNLPSKGKCMQARWSNNKEFREPKTAIVRNKPLPRMNL